MSATSAEVKRRRAGERETVFGGEEGVGAFMSGD
jgi:hypothetical protein